MDVEPRIEGRWVWTAPLGWRERHRVWQQGGRRAHRGWTSYDDVTPRLVARGEVVPYSIDVPAFWRYVADCGYRDTGYWEGGKARAGAEKWLEHFEGDREIRFLREADRVLRPGGKLCIAPIYFNHTYCIQTDLDAWPLHPPRFEGDAVICAAEGWGEVHGRFYDPAHFAERILANLGQLRLTLCRVQNYEDVARDCYLKFAAVFTRA
jgi:hypothetical protein